MNIGTNQAMIPFLKGGGEMASLIRQHPWSTTAVGSLTQWPQSLCTTLGLMLHSSLPMLLWWGKERLQFYNDAYCSRLLNLNKHPTALGQRGETCWSEQWPVLNDLIDRVLAGGKAIQPAAELTALTRHERVDYVTWTASYNPVWNEADRIEGVLVICQEASLPAAPQSAAPVPVQPATESGPVGLWTIDSTTMSVHWDEQCQALFGLRTGHQIAYQQALQLVHPDDTARVNQVVQGSLHAHSGKQFELTYRIVRADDGRVNWMHSTGWTFFNAQGNFGQVKGLTRPVSREPGTHAQLDQIERRFQNLIDAAPIAISVVRGPEFVIELVNQRMCVICNRTREQLVGSPLFSVLVESAGQGFEELLTSVMQTGVPFEGNELSVRLLRNGRPRLSYVSVSLVALREVDDQITGVTVAIVDVTDQVIARQQVESQAVQMQRVFSHAPTAIGIFRGPAFIIELANPSLCVLWGRTQEQVVGKSLIDALPEVRGQGFEELLTGVLLTGQPYLGKELPVTLNRNGKPETIYFDFIYEPLPEMDAHIERIIVTATDVTQQRQLRQQTEQLLNQERELNELKSNFVTLASHEFRTPMATILSSATLISGYNGPDDVAHRERHVQRIQTAIRYLMGLLNDFLSISQLEQKKLAGRSNQIVLGTFCADLIEEMQSLLKPGQHITHHHQQGESIIAIDDQIVKNILINLLSNASKYSAEGKAIDLTTAVQANQLLISVRDWGIGIPEADQDKLFVNFFRARNAIHVQGTGLGLYIVKRSVDLLGGTITFTSQLASGTQFMIQLPVARNPA